MTEKRYFLQFQGLRAVAFSAIFISHLAIGNFGVLGAWGVSVFMVLSGFLMMNSYWYREEDAVGCITFAYKKIKRLYVLHIVTMLCMVVIRVYSILLGYEEYPKLFLDILLHTTLMQVWIPDGKYYNTLNGPAWYLCACAFSYFCFPFILKKFKRIEKSGGGGMRYLVYILLTQLLISILALVFGNPEQNAFLSMKWITYYCPLARVADFLTGCCLGYIYIHKSKCSYGNEEKYVYSCLEIAVCVLIACSCMIYAYKILPFGSEFMKYSFLFTGTTAALIWLVAVNKGGISRILSGKWLCKIGNISPYAFLIHAVVIKYCRIVLNDLHKLSPLTLSVVSICLTGLATVIWIKIDDKYLRRKRIGEQI